MFLLGVAFAAETPRRTIDLPADTLERSLKRLSSESGVQIVFVPEVADGVRTSGLKGEFTVLEAANRLVAGTNLYVVNNQRTGVLSIQRAPSAGKKVAPAVPALTAGVRPPRSAATRKNAGADEDDDIPVELSPFTIVAERETGWVANQTLAGSRMKTEFKNVAQPLEVMTKDFMDDLALNNFEQALNYSTNVVGTQEYADNSNNNGIGFGNQQPKNNNLVRGLAGATNSVDFFESSMPSDGYNIERLTLARGPNAVLFGLGSPAGIVDSTLKRGNLRRDSVEVQLQVTSDSSKRGVFDVNRVIARDRVALRLAGMTDEGITRIKPNLDRQSRLYSAITAKPFKPTTLTVAHERASWNSNRAKTVLPVDSYAPWLQASQIAGSPYATNRPLFDNSRPLPANFNSNPIFTGPPNNSNFVMTFGGLGAIADGDTRRWNNSVSTRGFDAIPVALNPLNSYDRFTFSARDNDPVPFDTNIFGSSQFVRMKSDDWRVYVEQQLAKNLFLEGAWFHQGYFEQTATAGFTGIILMDANQFLPDQVTPNPNVGRYYTQRGGNANGNAEYEEGRDAYRATLSYEIDLRNKAGRLGQWLLGRLRPVVMAEQTNFRRRGEQFNRGILENPTITGAPILPTGSVGTGATGTGAQNWATNVQRDLITRFYLGGPAGNAPGNPFGDLYDTWQFKDAAGKPYAAYASWTPYTSAEGWPLARSASGAEGSKQKTNTLMFALQDYLLNDRLVLMYGFRKDASKSASLDPKYLKQDWSGMFPTWRVASFGPWGEAQSGKTETYGVVAHVTPWLSAIYNRSNTFQPNIGKFDPFGHEYPGATGLARDYGLNFSLFRDKLQARVSYYENTNGPIRAGNSPFQDPVRDNLLTIDQNIMTLDPSIPRLNAGAGGYRELGRANYWVMLDNFAKGYELSLTFRPRSNWDIVLNGAKNTTVQTDIGQAWFDWVAARLPVWQSLNVPEGGKSTPRDVNGDGRIGTWTWNTAPFDFSNGSRTFEQYYNETIVAQSLNLFRAYDGTSVDQGRALRGNVISQYRFTEGKLRGFSTNLAFRYRSAPTLGYRVVTGPGGVLLLDPAQPIKGPATVNTDLGLGYRGSMPFFNGLKYRLQLNVRNLLNEWTLVPVKALSTGQFARYNRLPPRTYILTSTFEF